MMRNWKMLALCSLLAAAAPQPVVQAGEEPDVKRLDRAQPPVPTNEDAKAILKGLDSLRMSIDALSKKLDAPPPVVTNAAPAAGNHDVLIEIRRLEKAIGNHIEKINADLKAEIAALQSEQLKQKVEQQALKGMKSKVEAIEEDVAALHNEVKKLRKQLLVEPTIPALPGADKGLDDIRGRLNAIEQALQRLVPAGPSTSNRIALSPPINEGIAGRVMLVNLYSEDILFTVNNQVHRVEPGRTKQLDAVPAGTLTYEVISPTWGRRAFRTTTLSPNETLTVSATR